MSKARFKAVLFDLDGTLADTAPDLVCALNRIRSEESLPPLPVAQMRTFASQGARGLLREGMGIGHEQADYPKWVERFLQHYVNNLCVETKLFEGMPELLQTLEAHGIAWGIVTNKHTRFTIPLMDALNLGQRSACIVCGDTTGHPKPAPDPVLHACELIKVQPADCIYVGDDLRDIQAGRAARTATLVAAWGYLGGEIDISDWGADSIVRHPKDIFEWLE